MLRMVRRRAHAPARSLALAHLCVRTMFIHSRLRVYERPTRGSAHALDMCSRRSQMAFVHIGCQQRRPVIRILLPPRAIAAGPAQRDTTTRTWRQAKQALGCSASMALRAGRWRSALGPGRQRGRGALGLGGPRGGGKGHYCWCT
jgi:hypothetical protein